MLEDVYNELLEPIVSLPWMSKNQLKIEKRKSPKH
jgi:hypothetical protein